VKSPQLQAEAWWQAGTGHEFPPGTATWAPEWFWWWEVNNKNVGWNTSWSGKPRISGQGKTKCTVKVTAFCKKDGSHADFCWIRKFIEICELVALVNGWHISDKFLDSKIYVDIFLDVVATIWHKFLPIYPMLLWDFPQGNKVKPYLIDPRM
jgi:hypothetical protein